ncbi:cytochrome P450 [Xylariaceae sp. FL1651]|nr:cytochrome P450 [Xylariaceae sp. FL1651]
MLPLLYIFVIALLVGYAVYLTALPRPIPGIPYHKSSAARVAGDALSMIRHARQHGTVFDWMAQQADALNSPIFQLFLKPFSKPAVFITDPREAQDILLRRTEDFDRSGFFQDVFAGTVPHCHVIQPTNEKFRQGRRLLADAMGAPFLNRVAAPLLHKHSLHLMELWRVKSTAAVGHAFWAADDISSFALDSIWDVAFGSQLDSLPGETDFLKSITKFEMPLSKDDPIDWPKRKVNEAADAMRVLTHGLDVAVTSPIPSLSHWLLSCTSSYRHARAYKEHLVKGRLDNAKSRLIYRTAAHKTTADDLEGITCATDHMVRRESQAARRENRTPNYESRQAQDELFGFLVGGYDTTATTLMWSTKLMADNPHVQSKLRKALWDIFGNNGIPPTPEQITTTRIPYLDAVVEEVIRCAQTASSAIRVALRDTQLLGYRIPKGVDVYMLSNGPGYMKPDGVNQSIPEAARSHSSRQNKRRAMPSWAPDDIAAFRPERWIKVSERGIENFNANAGPSMQFGMGLRGCFGKRLAYLEIRILLVMLLWNFELRLVPEKLRGYEAFDTLTHKPKKCYIDLRQLELQEGGGGIAAII